MLNEEKDKIKIARQLMTTVRDDVFVSKVGSGRHHCLMGIHGIGKTTLVSDWQKEWETSRNTCLTEFKAKNTKKILGLILKEKEPTFDELPEMAKIFLVMSDMRNIDVEHINPMIIKILKDILNPGQDGQSYYEKKGQNYIVKTNDGFRVKITENDKKEAVEKLGELYFYFIKAGGLKEIREIKEYIANVKELFEILTCLGLHLILVLDEFNNAKTEDVRRKSRRKNADEKKEVIDESERKKKEEVKELLLDLMSDLCPYIIDSGKVTERRKYNLSMLIISRQEMGMITGNEMDDDIFKPNRLDGFSNAELDEFITRLFQKMEEKYDGCREEDNIIKIFGEFGLKRQMIHYCGRHPGLWSRMSEVIEGTYEMVKLNCSAEMSLEKKFLDYNKEFFRNVIYLMKATTERVDNQKETTAMKVFIHHFVDNMRYPIPNDDERQALKKYLKIMEQQGFVVGRDYRHCFEVLEQKAELGQKLDSTEESISCKEWEDRMLGYELHSPYFIEYIEDNPKECYNYDRVDVENALDECENWIGKQIEKVYITKYGEKNWVMKLKNRMHPTKVAQWYARVCKQFPNRTITYAEKEEAALKNSSPIKDLSFGEIGELILMHSDAFEPILSEWERNKFFQFHSYKVRMAAMKDLRNQLKHNDPPYDVTMNAEKDMEMCCLYLQGVKQGSDEIVRCAIDSPTDVIDLFNVDFVCVDKFDAYAFGTITHEGEEYSAKIYKAKVSKSGKGGTEYFDNKIKKGESIKVDVVEWREKETAYEVRPMDRCGIPDEWE